MSVTLLPLDPLPNHWHLLCEEDQQQYLLLRAQFLEAIAKSRRGERIEVFIQRLKTVKAFIDKDPQNLWKRAIVCGIMFLKSALAINIQQLRILMGKCKSSINGSLQQIGYVSKPSTHEIDQEMTAMIPALKDDHSEMKKWTIRYGIFPDDDRQAESPTSPEPEEVFLPSPEVGVMARRIAYPCPAKCRHKFYDILHISISSQTEI
jgi:hypothetical protein